MTSIIFSTTLGGMYTGGISYLLKASALDKKVFDFTAPFFKDAFAFGALYSLTNLTLEAGIRELTGTTFTRESMMYAGTYREMHSQHPKVYSISSVLAKIISAFGSAYALKQMNYSVSYRFAVVCMLPSVIMWAAKKID